MNAHDLLHAIFDNYCNLQNAADDAGRDFGWDSPQYDAAKAARIKAYDAYTVAFQVHRATCVTCPQYA